MNRGGPTHLLLLDLCARLRLACEAVGERGVEPSDVSLDDLAPGERTRLRHLAVQDLWALINGTSVTTTHVKPARHRAKKRRRGAA